MWQHCGTAVVFTAVIFKNKKIEYYTNLTVDRWLLCVSTLFLGWMEAAKQKLIVWCWFKSVA